MADAAARELSAARGAVAIARITCREVLAAGYGAPWLGAVAAACVMARRSAAIDAAATPWLRAAIHLGVGVAVALTIAAFAPIALAGRRHGRSGAPLVAARPLSPIALAAGPALGAALAACAVAAAFLATMPLAGARVDGLRLRLGAFDVSRDLLAENGDATEVRGDAPAGSSLRVAPRIGYASGFGDPNAVRLRIEVDAGGARTAREAELRGRESATVDLGGAGPVIARVTRVGGDVPARWPAGSIALLGGDVGTWRFALRVLGAVAVAAIALACVSSALASALDRPVAAFGAASLAIVALATPHPALRGALGLASLLDVTGWAEREIAPFDVAAAARALAVAAAALGAGALVRARRR